METRLLLRNGEQLLLAVVIPLIVLVGGITAAKHFDLTFSPQPGRHPDPGRPRAGGDVDELHLAGHRHRLRAPLRRAQAARRLAAPRGPGCSPARSVRCSSSRCCSSWSSAGPRRCSAGRRTCRSAGLLGALACVAAGHGGVRLARPVRRRRAARRGHAGRREPGLPAADGRRRRGVPGRRPTAPRGRSLALLPSGALGAGMRDAFLDGRLPRRTPARAGGWTAVGTALTARTFTWE